MCCLIAHLAGAVELELVVEGTAVEAVAAAATLVTDHWSTILPTNIVKDINDCTTLAS